MTLQEAKTVVGGLLVAIIFGLTFGGGCGTVTKNNPRTVVFDVNRTTCAIWVDVDGKRSFEVNPGKDTKCQVDVR